MLTGPCQLTAEFRLADSLKLRRVREYIRAWGRNRRFDRSADPRYSVSELMKLWICDLTQPTDDGSVFFNVMTEIQEPDFAVLICGNRLLHPIPLTNTVFSGASCFSRHSF